MVPLPDKIGPAFPSVETTQRIQSRMGITQRRIGLVPGVFKLLIAISIFAAAASLATASTHAQDVRPLTSDIASDTPLVYDEKEAQRIDGMLMCPVCPAETIDQAQVPIARQMRQLVRDKLVQGEDRDQILDYFAGVYGQDILAAPGKSGVNLVAWTVPVAGVMAALAAGFFVLRAMSARPSAETPEVPTGLQLAEETMAPYLEAIDQELALPDGRSGALVPEAQQAAEPEIERKAREGHG